MVNICTVSSPAWVEWQPVYIGAAIAPIIGTALMHVTPLFSRLRIVVEIRAFVEKPLSLRIHYDQI
jgi:hypothetical protein